MAATNEKALGKYPWLVYVWEYTSDIPALLDDMSNANAVTAYIDSNIVFKRLASVIDVQVSTNLNADVVEVVTDDNWTIYKATTPEVKITWQWYESWEVDTVKTITGQNDLSVAGTLVSWASQTIASWTKAYNEYTALENQNGDGSAISITSVTGWTDWALVADTDYVLTEVNWVYGITILDSTTVTTMAQDFVIVYDYTPTATKYLGLNVKALEIPKMVVKIVSSDWTNTNTEYLINSWFEWELIGSYIDVVRAWDLTPSAFDFKANKLGSRIGKYERF